MSVLNLNGFLNGPLYFDIFGTYNFVNCVNDKKDSITRGVTASMTEIKCKNMVQLNSL